ncbi:MAG TPA: hypothetical protein VGE59_00130 [Patescibacteria group bacterium]
MKPIRIGVRTQDGLALATVESLLTGAPPRQDGSDGGPRRPRIFEKINETTWRGEIHYGEGQYRVPVEVIIAPNGSYPTADWYVLSAGHIPCARQFTMHPRATRFLSDIPPGKHLVLSQQTHRGTYRDLDDPEKADTVPTPKVHKGQVASKAGRTLRQHFERLARNAANLLAAELTSQNVWRPYVLSFPYGDGARHFRTVAGWIQQETPLHLMSGICLHATECRSQIVQRLNERVIELLCRTAKCAFDPFPSIQGWTLSTFGPEDYEWLGDLGLSKVLLPYMWDAPRGKVVADLKQNMALTQQVAQRLNGALRFPVTTAPLSSELGDIDLEWLTQAAEERAHVMLEAFGDSKPEIFKLMSPADQIARLRMEAFLYLLDTCRFGQVAGENRPAHLYIGLEVHGGYWQKGNLSEGPKGEYLPLAWFNKCVGQHWGEWVLARNSTRQKEMMRLGTMLQHLGY